MVNLPVPGPDDQPLTALAIDGEVVICSVGHGRVCIAMTPEAVLDSIEVMRAAAEEAIRQRHGS